MFGRGPKNLEFKNRAWAGGKLKILRGKNCYYLLKTKTERFKYQRRNTKFMTFTTFDNWQNRSEVILPINPEFIPGFKDWVNWNGFRSDNHQGFDFAAYFNRENLVVLGLPKKTPVRAIYDGIVRFDSEIKGDKMDYLGKISIEHGKNTGLYSTYSHIVPNVKTGDSVERGQVIGNLFADEGDVEGRLVHLHFAIMDRTDFRLPERDPRILFPELYSIPKGYPQGQIDFRVNGNSRVEVANYQRLICDND